MLTVRSVSKSFGGVRAVRSVSIEVEAGRIIGLIGTNGAGKTTLFNVVSGLLPADSGTISFLGRDITRSRADRSSALGMVRTFQTPVGFPQMTVMENMLVFDRHDSAGLLAPLVALAPPRPKPATVARAVSVLERFGLAAKRDLWVQDLSAPELKMLEFARAVMADPKIMLLDEPAAGVNPAVLDQLIETIEDLRRQGMTFLIVDHNLKFMCGICDYIYAMADGELIAQGTPDEVVANQAVLDCYIGRRPKAQH